MRIPLKLTLFSAVLSVVFTASSCGLWGSSDGIEGEPADASESASNIPFLTKEPDRYQANISVTAFEPAGAAAVLEYILAKRGTEIALVIGPGMEKERRFIDLDDGRKIIVEINSRSYRVLAGGPGGSDLARELTRGWLSVTPGTKYEELGTTDGITRYRVSPEGLEESEMIVFYDEELQFPVGSEFYSLIEGDRHLSFKYEITDFIAEPDEKLFRIPKGFKEEPGSQR